jgi:prepilin-type N-terminal cleavage/methylation domain-containing protein
MTMFRHTTIGTGSERLAGLMDVATEVGVIARLQPRDTIPYRRVADDRDVQPQQSGLRMGGFTLLEVIIALIIAGMAAVVLFEAAGSGLHATQTASMYDQAIVRAKSRLAAAVHGTKLQAGDWRGDDGGGFRWRLRVAPVATASVHPIAVAGARAASSVPVVLYGISVWIGWNDGGTERQVQLDTEQVGG